MVLVQAFAVVAYLYFLWVFQALQIFAAPPAIAALAPRALFPFALDADSPGAAWQPWSSSLAARARAALGGAPLLSSLDDEQWLVLVNVLLLGVPLALQHWVCARAAFKRALLACDVPVSAERSLFVATASAAVHFGLANWRAGSARVLARVPDAAQSVVVALWALGAVAGLAATFNIDHFSLFGLRQAFAGDAAVTSAARRGEQKHVGANLVVSGLYHWVRHPLMTATLVVLGVAVEYTWARVVFAVANVAWVSFTVRVIEEPGLVAELGDQYRNYQRHVPMLCPMPFVHSAPSVAELRKPTRARK